MLTRERDILCQNSVVEDGAESKYSKFVGSDCELAKVSVWLSSLTLDVSALTSPSKRRLEQEEGGEVGEASVIGDGEHASRLQVGNAGTAGAADGRQRDGGDLVTLPDDVDSFRELRTVRTRSASARQIDTAAAA